MLPVELGFASAGALNDSDARLIWELVANITPPADVLVRYGLTPADLAAKKNDKMFVAAFKEAKALWASDLNVQQRIRIKAALLTEDTLMDIFMIAKNPDMNAQYRLEASKHLAAMGDALPKKGGEGGGGAGFKLTINMGDNSPRSVTIDGHALPAPAAESA